MIFFLSTDCENLLKKFLVLNPGRRASLEVIMKDKWMNMGYEEEELLPFIEPVMDMADQKRIDSLVQVIWVGFFHFFVGLVTNSILFC